MMRNMDTQDLLLLEAKKKKKSLVIKSDFSSLPSSQPKQMMGQSSFRKRRPNSFLYRLVLLAGAGYSISDIWPAFF